MKNAGRHIALAGDSIFDNDGYVGNDPGVIEQLRMSVPKDWSAMKIAVDGDCIRHVYSRLPGLPSHITDLVLSIGGNDAIGYSHFIDEAKSIADLPGMMAAPIAEFQENYRALLAHVQGVAKQAGFDLTVCTIYTAVPFDNPVWREYVPIALTVFNNVIRSEAAAKDIPVIGLEHVCKQDQDFAACSPIEPSSIGGQKIVDAILASLTGAEKD